MEIVLRQLAGSSLSDEELKSIIRKVGRRAGGEGSSGWRARQQGRGQGYRAGWWGGQKGRGQGGRACRGQQGLQAGARGGAHMSCGHA